MKEFLALLKCSVRKLPCRFCCIEHHKCPEYICLYKYIRIFNASINMTLCSKMYYSVNLVLFKNLVNRICITDICLYKCVIFSVFYIFQVLKISCICQLIYIDDADFVVILFKHVMNVV